MSYDFDDVNLFTELKNFYGIDIFRVPRRELVEDLLELRSRVEVQVPKAWYRYNTQEQIDRYQNGKR